MVAHLWRKRIIFIFIEKRRFKENMIMHIIQKACFSNSSG